MLELNRKQGQRIFLCEIGTNRVKCIMNVTGIGRTGVGLSFRKTEESQPVFVTEPYGRITSDPFGLRWSFAVYASGGDVLVSCSCDEKDVLYREEVYKRIKKELY